MHLKNRRFQGLKFKRQVVIGPFIYDFECFERKMIIELDGSQHKLAKKILKDLEKQSHAEKLGYKVMRFNNNDVQYYLEGVLETIHSATKQ